MGSLIKAIKASGNVEVVHSLQTAGPTNTNPR